MPLIQDEDLSNNRSTRIPLCFCIETSEYVYRPDDRFTYNQVINCLSKLKDKINATESLRYSVECSVLAFAGSARAVTEDFIPGRSFTPTPPPAMSGEPDLQAALELAVRQIRKRGNIHRINKDAYYKPILMLISSGRSTPQLSESFIKNFRYQADSSLSFIPIIIGGFNDTLLRSLSPDDFVHHGDNKLDEIFEQFGVMIEAMSTSSQTMYGNIRDVAISWEEYIKKENK